ncbi:GTPase [Methylotuvimicrobium sp. KM2]|uniref:GTPase n=1 Tax=Methylotuvimicrobium sp. KM2 TaxID=3133976 RepID=UPI0031011584
MKRFLLVGKTGVGKSSFVNASFGVELARCNRYEACTKLAETYSHGTEYGPLCLIDTPGLADDCRETDFKYLKIIREFIAENPIDTALFLSRLDDTRFRAEDKETLRLITEQLGSSIWRNAWLVFTFCAEVEMSKLNEAANARICEIEDYLRRVRGNASFTGFNKYILIDNVKVGWHPNASVITEALCEES